MATYVAKQHTTSGGMVGGYYKDQLPSPSTVAPTATAPVNRTIYDGNQYNPGPSDPADQFLSTFRAPESSDQIFERKRQQSQGLIDSINKQFDDRVNERKQVGLERVKMDNAISVLTGNMGGTEAVSSRNKVNEGNAKEIDAVNNQRAMALAQVYSQINRDVDTEAREQLADATRSAEQIIARRKEAQASAVENLKLLASSGQIDFDAFKTSPQNKKVYDYALQSVGGSEDALRGLFALNRPQDQVLDKRVVGSTMYITYQNPVTGKVSNDHFNLGFEVPVEWKNVDLGGQVMFYDPANPDNRKYYSKSMTPDQMADNARMATQARTPGSLKETGAERTALGFYIRGKDAIDTISTIEEDIASKTLAGQARLEYAPNWAQSKDNQVYRQLQRQFTEARLRKESGAAIPAAEYVSDAKTYFAQPGDTKETLQRKYAARAKVLESLRVGAGNAYTNYYANEGSAGPTSNIIVAPDGQEVEIIDE